MGFKEDNEASTNIRKSGGSQKLVHMIRTHRIDAASTAGQFGEGGPYTPVATCAADPAADMCAECFDGPR